MNIKFKSMAALAATIVTTLSISAVALDAKYQPIADAMKYAFKAPKPEKKIGEKIIDGTATEDEIKKSLELFKGMANTEPPKGDAAAFKEKVAKLISATEDVLAKKEGAGAKFKEAADCKACHKEFRPQEEKKP